MAAGETPAEVDPVVAGNRERLREHLGKDNPVLFSYRQRARKRRAHPAGLAEPAHAHLRLVRLSSPRGAARWLARVEPPV